MQPDNNIGGSLPFSSTIFGKNNKWRNGENGKNGEEIDGENGKVATMVKMARKSMARMAKIDGENDETLSRFGHGENRVKK